MSPKKSSKTKATPQDRSTATIQDSRLKQLLEELFTTLDCKQTLAKLDMDEDEARSLLRHALASVSVTATVPSVSSDDMFEMLAAPAVLPPTDDDAAATSLIMYVDGASRGNPGKAGAGVLVQDAHGKTIRRLRKRLPDVTNNVAEYSALLTALKAAVKMNAKKLKVFADSELMVKQINGLYRVKNEGLKPLYAEAKMLINKIDSFSIAHVKRELNAGADKLANEAIDGV